jgi:hypothetical protein
MPAFKLAQTRARRPLTCDVCQKPIVPIAVVAVCSRCKRVRHLPCAKVPCPACASLVFHTAIYRIGKILRYM